MVINYKTFSARVKIYKVEFCKYWQSFTQFVFFKMYFETRFTRFKFHPVLSSKCSEYSVYVLHIQYAQSRSYRSISNTLSRLLFVLSSRNSLSIWRPISTCRRPREKLIRSRRYCVPSKWYKGTPSSPHREYYYLCRTILLAT